MIHTVAAMYDSQIRGIIYIALLALCTVEYKQQNHYDVSVIEPTKFFIDVFVDKVEQIFKICPFKLS